MPLDGSSKPLLERSESEQDAMNNDYENSTERTSLLETENTPRYDGEEREAREDYASVSSVSTASGVPVPKVEGKSWASITAIIALSIAITFIIIGVFVIPASVEEYGRRALVIEPKGMSIDSFTRTDRKSVV